MSRHSGDSPRFDRPRVEAAVRELLIGVGLDPDTPELVQTPRRVTDAYGEFFSGLGDDPLRYLEDTIPVGDDTGDLVLLRDISFTSMCEHHLLPFRGRAHVAYSPGSKIVGLSALPRVVHAIASRPQMQERLGEEIVQALEHALAPRGALVVIEASHGCVTHRGVRQSESTTVTIASRGSLADPTQRANVMALIGGGA